MTTRAQKTLVLAQKSAFLGHCWANNGPFLGGLPSKTYLSAAIACNIYFV